MSNYEEEVSKQPRRRPTAKEWQQWRYGSKIDEERHATRQAVVRYFQWIIAAIPVAAALAEIFNFLARH